MATPDYVGSEYTDVLISLEDLRTRLAIMKQEMHNRHFYDPALSSQFGLLTIAAAPLIKVVPDVTAPTVSATSPVNGATNVAVDASLTITFDDTMLASTIDATSCKLVATGGGAADVATVDATLSGGLTQVTLTMAGDLSADTVYKFRVTTAVTDLSGNALAATFTSAAGFHTAA